MKPSRLFAVNTPFTGETAEKSIVGKPILAVAQRQAARWVHRRRQAATVD
jgi:hypothetical protein